MSLVRLKLNYTLNSFADNSDQEDEGDVPMAQRKRFTRVEMARVLMERNQVRNNVTIFNDQVKLKSILNKYSSTKNVSWNCKMLYDGQK